MGAGNQSQVLYKQYTLLTAAASPQFQVGHLNMNMCYTCNLKSNAYHVNSEPMMVREELGCNRHMAYIGSISDINP